MDHATKEMPRPRADCVANTRVAGQLAIGTHTHTHTHTSLAPRGIAPSGGPRTRLLSKITGALGALRTVIQWQRAQLGIKGTRVPASAKRKAKQVFRPGAMPKQVELSWQAACRRMRKTGLAFREDLLLHEFVAIAPDPTLPVDRPVPALVGTMSAYDRLCLLGKKYARHEERTRIEKWKSKMDMRFAISKPKFGLCKIECICVCTDCPLSCLLYFVCRRGMLSNCPVGWCLDRASPEERVLGGNRPAGQKPGNRLS